MQFALGIVLDFAFQMQLSTIVYFLTSEFFYIYIFFVGVFEKVYLIYSLCFYYDGCVHEMMSMLLSTKTCNGRD